MPATGAALGIERILAALPGSEGRRGRLDVAVTVGEALAARPSRSPLARAVGLRAAVYPGSPGKLGKQPGGPATPGPAGA